MEYRITTNTRNEIFLTFNTYSVLATDDIEVALDTIREHHAEYVKKNEKKAEKDEVDIPVKSREQLLGGLLDL